MSGRLNQHHGAAIAYIELRAVIADANPEVKTESITEPGNRLSDVEVREFGDDDGGWHRAIRQHLGQLYLGSRPAGAATETVALAKTPQGLRTT